jgi:hypothetical protein
MKFARWISRRLGNFFYGLGVRLIIMGDGWDVGVNVRTTLPGSDAQVHRWN